MRNRFFNAVSSGPRKRGFTLVEVTIVLGVAGILFGGVWVAAQKVWDNYHTYRASQEITKVVQNIREYAAGTQGLQFQAQAVTACDDATGYLDALGTFPAEMRRYCPSCTGGGTYNYKVDNPFNNQDTYSGTKISAGSFRVFGIKCTGNNAGHFQVLLMFVPSAICAKLLMSAVNYNDPSLGVTGMCASSSVGPSTGSGGSCFTAGNGQQTYTQITQQSNGTWGTNATTPLTLAVAQSLCRTPASTTGYSEVGWEFKVRN